jgi:tetratricopeptide (TPR) repeat protein
MKDARVHRLLIAIAIVLFSSTTAWARPKVFADQPLDTAKAQARAQKKILIIDFTAVWCGPCHKMDDTTWSDEGVRKWLGENAVAVQIDVDHEHEIAAAYRVSAMPTIVAVLPSDMSKEFDRNVGYQSPAEFLRWLTAVKQGKSSTAVLSDQLAAIAGKGGKEETNGRYKIGKQLTTAGRYAEATDQYIWLWENIPHEDPPMEGVRLSFIASDMENLAKMYAPARERFLPLRATALAAGNRTDWIVLNRVLNDEQATLDWFDHVKGKPFTKQELNDKADRAESTKDDQNQSKADADKTAVEGETEGMAKDQPFAKDRFFLQELLVRKNRWADVALYLYPDPLKKLRETHESAQRVRSLTKAIDPFPREAATFYTCFLAAHFDELADKIARESLRLENSTKLRTLLVSVPFNAGFLKPAQLKWLDEIPPTMSDNLYWERASLYAMIGENERALQDFDKAVAVAVSDGKPNTALYCARGVAYYKLHRDNLAMADYNLAEKTDPKSAWSWINKSALYYRQKKYAQAYADAEKAVALDPKSMEAYCNRGEAALKLGHLDQAISDLSRAVESKSHNVAGEAHYYRGLAYTRAGKSDLAAQDKKTAGLLQFKPDPGE